MTDHPRWLPLDEIPDDGDWRPPPGLSRADRSAEQDQAAGGRGKRQVQLANGRTATASVELKRLPHGRRVYAYLRYTQEGKTVNRYIGDATASSRTRTLKLAWRLAREKGLLCG